MRRTRLVVVALLLGLCAGGALGDPADEYARPAPEFSAAPQDWLNSGPLRWQDLAGKVVVLEFWTSDCGNCIRSAPWLTGLAQRLASRGVVVIGVHTPEYEREKPRARVLEAMQVYGIGYPVMMDNDARYWRAINNHFWPTFYVVDKRGLIRAALAGETRAGDANAVAIEGFIDELLAEPG